MNRPLNQISDWNDLIGSLWQKGLSVAIGVFNIDGSLLTANPAMCYYLAADPIDLKPTNQLINPSFASLCLQSERELVFEGLMTIGNYLDVSYVLQSKVFRRGDSLLVYAELDAPALIAENTKMSQLNQEVNNLQRTLIKEKKLLQDTLQELKETQQMLIHSEKMNAMGKLVAGVAHELNNPISFVYSNLFTLEGYISEVFDAYTDLEAHILERSNEELKEVVSTMRKQKELDYLMEDIKDMTKESKIGMERVKSIVEDLRTFSRLDESEHKTVNLLENVRSTLTILRPALNKEGIDFMYSIPDIEVECYPGQLNQAIMNVLINAVQAVGSKGTIRLEVEDLGTSVRFDVKDDGCGIPEEYIDRVFDPFFTTKPVGSGTGLGLSITYKIVHDLHHGNIEIHSAPGNGCHVVFTIPKNATYES